MGGKSNKSSGGSSIPKATEAGAMGMYDKMLGGQLGAIGDAFGGLVDRGMQFMDDNPGKANFIRAVTGMPIQLDTPDSIQGFIDKYKPKEPAEPVAPAPYNINDDMRARMGMGSPYGQSGQYGQYGQYGPYGQYNPQRTSMFGGQ